jgi:hypothetical protein
MMLCVFCTAFIPQCSRGLKDDDKEKAIAAALDKTTVFFPPPDSAISPRQMTAWFSSNHALDSLSSVFTESLSHGNTFVNDRIQKAYSYGQDRICIKKGLRGGYNEYLWISDHLGSTANKPVYDSLRRKTRGSEN